MAKLSNRAIENLIDHLRTASVLLKELPRSDLRGKLEHFENQLTLNEIDACFTKPLKVNLEERLVALLAHRWKRIFNSSMSYPNSPFNPVNQLCLSIAKALSPLPIDESEIDNLEPLEGPYFLLMPTLKAHKNIFESNIHNLAFQQFILSDDGSDFIDIFTCLEVASESGEGLFKHQTLETHHNELSPTELACISHHYPPVVAYYQAILAYNQKRIYGIGLGAALQRLYNALVEGGAHQDGQEFDSGRAANAGIVEFYNYWEAFSSQQQQNYFSRYPELVGIVGRLMRPKDRNYQDTVYCVELIANEINEVVRKYHANANGLDELNARVNRTKERARHALAEPFHSGGLTLNASVRSPRVLVPIFNLKLQQQEEIFGVGKNAWIHALEHDIEGIAEFRDVRHGELSRLANCFKFSKLLPMFGGGVRKIQHLSPLINAAKAGCLEAVQTLVELQVNIEQTDELNNTALIWAANDGQTAVVNYLLEKKAEIDFRGNDGRTALHWSIMHRQLGVIESLVAHNADPFILDHRGVSVFQEAIAEHQKDARLSPLPILLAKLITWPLGDQERLLRTNNYRFNNILPFVFSQFPELFPVVLAKAIEDRNASILNSVYYFDGVELNVLMMATKCGAIECIKPLIQLFPYQAYQQDQHQRSMLVWAVNEGQKEIAQILIENNPGLIDVSDDTGCTPLHHAVATGHLSMVSKLLECNANVLLRNNQGSNVLEDAVSEHPEMVSTILASAAILPQLEQRELLMNISGGSYPNVFAYILSERLPCWDRVWDDLIKKHDHYRSVKNYLDDIGFIRQIADLKKKAQALAQEAIYNPDYRAAAQTAQILLRRLVAATATFCLLETSLQEGSEQTKHQFQESCLASLHEATPVLEKHRGWKQILAILLIALTFPISLPIYGIGRACGFFSPLTQTDSAKKLHAMKDAINLSMA